MCIVSGHTTSHITSWSYGDQIIRLSSAPASHIIFTVKASSEQYPLYMNGQRLVISLIRKFHDTLDSQYLSQEYELDFNNLLYCLNIILYDNLTICLIFDYCLHIHY